jgi:TM2 domain-containing membrane protein YozV
MAEPEVSGEPELEAKPRHWWAALLLSLFQPGLGQFYNGEVGKALAFFVLPFLFRAAFVATALRPISFALPVLLVALAVLVQIGAAAEAAWTAGRQGPAARQRPYDRWYVYALAFALAWLLASSAVRMARRFVQSGDNRDNSYDSRFTGPVPRSSVEGGGRIRVYWSRNPTTGEVRWDRVGRFLR